MDIMANIKLEDNDKEIKAPYLMFFNWSLDRRLGLTRHEAVLLCLVYEAERQGRLFSMPLRAIAQRIGFQIVRTARSLKRLQSMGYICIQPKERRSKALRIAFDGIAVRIALGLKEGQELPTHFIKLYDAIMSSADMTFREKLTYCDLLGKWKQYDRSFFPVSLNEIAKDLRENKSHLSVVVKSLISKGFVTSMPKVKKKSVLDLHPLREIKIKIGKVVSKRKVPKEIFADDKSRRRNE